MRTVRLNKEFEIFIAGIGAAQSFLMSFYSFYERKKDFRNLLLALFFLSVTLRLTKSILWVYLDFTPQWLINFGFLAHSVSGPALFLYSFYFLFPKQWSSNNLAHFIPSALLLFFISSLTLSNFWYSGGYSLLLFHQVAYSVMALILLSVRFLSKKHMSPMDKTSIIWITTLILGTALFQFLYFSNYILGLTPYLLGPVIYLPFIYFLAFLLFKNPSLLKHESTRKHQNIRLTKGELLIYAKQLETIMQDQKLYLDSDCTLNSVAKQAKLPPYLVSHIVNNTIGKSFPDFLNEYRIKTAQDLLLDPRYKEVKISSIAYDCGFNTLSSFNSAFKKFTGSTPSRFQKNNVTG
ncbi:MAG: helix-turn-helix domain-containing protein [Flavobacteriaceae bacterium]